MKQCAMRQNLPKTFFKENSRDLKQRIGRAEQELMRGEVFYSIQYLLRYTLFKFLSELRGIYTTHWATECELEPSENGYTFVLHPSRRNGVFLEDIFVERTYKFVDGSINIEENVKGETKMELKKIIYQINPHCKDLQIETNCCVKKSRGILVFIPDNTKPLRIIMSFVLN